MISPSRSPGRRRKASDNKAPLSSCREHIHNLRPEERPDFVRRLVSPTPRNLRLPLPLPAPATENGDSLLRPSKMLLKVTIENSLGAIPVLMLPEDTVGDLVRAALVIYDKEKRRPFLKVTDPKRYDLHYSPYTLDSLKPNEKLLNVGSRNFFLCSKPPASTCSKEENLSIDSAFPLTMFVNLLL